MQPVWCQGANLFPMNEFRIIKLVLSTAVLISPSPPPFCFGGEVFSIILPNTSMLQASYYGPLNLGAMSNAVLPSDSRRLFMCRHLVCS